MAVQQVAPGGAVFLLQGALQLLAAGGAQQEGQGQTGFDGGPQVHFPEGVGVPGPQGVYGGGVALVLADDVGVVRLAPAHQHAQLRDDLEVDGVPSAPDALNILYAGLGPGAELFDFAEGQTGFLIKDQHRVLLGEHVNALQAGSDVVVSVY